MSTPRELAHSKNSGKSTSCLSTSTYCSGDNFNNRLESIQEEPKDKDNGM
jgi:hypothetical protein